MARWATFIHRQGNPDAAWLTVDAGNYVDRDVKGGCSSKCQFMVTSYKDLHYDVLNLGQQEVWMGHDVIKDMIDTTQNTDFVSANVLEKQTHKPLAKPFVVRDFGKMRVGVLGLVNEGEFPKGSTLLDSTKLEITPHLDAAKKYLPSLERKTDAVVVLCGLTSSQIDTLVQQFPGIDLIISSGALRQGETAYLVGKTHVVGTGTSGYNGHWAMLDFNPATKDSVGFTAFMDPLTDGYEESGQWADRLAAFNAAPPPPPPAAKPLNAPSTTATPNKG